MHNLSNLTFTVQVFKEGKSYVSYNPELDVSSCGGTPHQAKENLKDAIRGFLEVVSNKGTLNDILEEAGFIKKQKHWEDPNLVSLDRLTVGVA